MFNRDCWLHASKIMGCLFILFLSCQTGFHFALMQNETKDQEKNKLPPALNFLIGYRITAAKAGKSIHAFARPHFFRPARLS